MLSPCRSSRQWARSWLFFRNIRKPSRKGRRVIGDSYYVLPSICLRYAFNNHSHGRLSRGVFLGSDHTITSHILFRRLACWEYNISFDRSGARDPGMMQQCVNSQFYKRETKLQCPGRMNEQLGRDMCDKKEWNIRTESCLLQTSVTYEVVKDSTSQIIRVKISPRK